MPRYRLLEAHYSEEDKWLPGDKENEHLGDRMGTIVGDGSPHKWSGPPTPAMEGLDDKSQALIDKEAVRGHGLNPVDYLPLTQGDTIDPAAENVVLAKALKRLLMEA